MVVFRGRCCGGGGGHGDEETRPQLRQYTRHTQYTHYTPHTTHSLRGAHLLLELLHRLGDLLEVVRGERALQVLRDRADVAADGAHLGLRVEARDGRVEARRELQVVEVLGALADRVLMVVDGVVGVVVMMMLLVSLAWCCVCSKCVICVWRCVAVVGRDTAVNPCKPLRLKTPPPKKTQLTSA